MWDGEEYIFTTKLGGKAEISQINEQCISHPGKYDSDIKDFKVHLFAQMMH